MTYFQTTLYPELVPHITILLKTVGLIFSFKGSNSSSQSQKCATYKRKLMTYQVT